MAPRIGTRATLGGKTVIWSGENYGYQSPASHKKLQQQGKFNLGAQALDRLTSSVVNNPIIKRLGKEQDKFRNATDKLPGVGPLLKAIERNGPAVASKTPSGVVGQGASIATDAISRRLGIDPRLALVGMVGLNAGGLVKGPKATATKRGIGLDDVGDKPQFTGRTTVPPKANLPKPQPVGQTNLDKLPRDIYPDAYGPASKQFGANPVTTAEQRAFGEGMQPVPGGTGKPGRPSAKASSPALQQLTQGVRKQTGQQRVRDRLNSTRQRDKPPTGSPPPKFKPLPKLDEAQRAILDRLKAAADKLDSLTAGSRLRSATRQNPGVFTDLNKPSLGDKSTKGTTRRLVDPSDNPAPIRRDSQGNIIKPPKAERNKPSTRTDAIKQRLDGYQGYRGQGATQANADRPGRVRQTSGQSVGSHFQGDGELSGVRHVAPANKGRSSQSRNQTMKTLKAMLDRAILADNMDKVRSVKALIKRLSK